jgi:cell wall-associated NlpC family hydrolase
VLRFAGCFAAACILLLPVSFEAAETKAKKKSPAAAPTETKKASQQNAAATPKPKRADASETDVSAKPEPESRQGSSTVAPNVAIASEELIEFRKQPAAVKTLLESCLELARQNLTYTFGSSDPANGGMDCSGFIYYALRQHGFTQVPRDSSGQYVWVRKARLFRPVISRKPDSFEFEELLPGDLLFWTGTYATQNDPPISHVMIYLGTEKATGNKVMIGSSDGRSYHGQKRNGVSVFDFVMPRVGLNVEQRSTFVGYSLIPALRD